MVISYNTQLGLRFKDEDVKVDFLKLMREYLENELGLTQELIEKLSILPVGEKAINENGTINLQLTEEQAQYFERTRNDIPENKNENKVRAFVTKAIGDVDIVGDENSFYYFICDSVYKAAELIKVSSGFTGRTLKDIAFGKYTYLLGKYRMVRFLVGLNAIKGFYYDTEKRVVFEWGIEMENGEYYCSHNRSAEFSEIMRILTFVELGDIEIKEIPGGQNNGKAKKNGKITNTSIKTVFVVDSNWNTLVIRTDGFAVRGHYRLQPCGTNFADRKLIWIDAFEKHGYKRRPTGDIVK